MEQTEHKEHRGVGNTSTTPLRVKSRKWCFTLNNYTEEDVRTIISIFNAKKWKYIFGKEIGECKTPHLQGYIEHTSGIMFDTLKALIPRAHIEKARGSTEQNVKYCSKEDPNPTTNITRTLTIEDEIEAYNQNKYRDVVWKDWQQEILDIIETEPDERTVNWFWEPTGKSGKSFLTRYIHWKHRTIIVNGKQTDVFNGIKTYIEKRKKLPRIIIIDIPRINQNYVCYSTMEKIKDGLMYSGKYEGGIIELLPVHMFIFANFEPNTELLSEDRWNIREI